MIKLIPNSKKGNGIFVFCYKCNTSVTHSRKCNHKSRWVYKTDVRIAGKRVSKCLKASDFNSALVELSSMKKNAEQKSKITLHQNNKTIIYAVKKYLDYVFNKQEYESEVQNTKQHKDDCARIIKRYCESLDNAGINLKTTSIDTLNESTLAGFYNLIKTKYRVKAQISKDKHTRIMRNFFKFIQDSGIYKGSAFFSRIKTAKIKSNPVSISKIEFHNVLISINYENGWSYGGGVKRNLYTDWLKNAFLLARLTGLRREELYHMKWDNIIIKDGYKVLLIKDFKASKSKKEDVFKAVAIYGELKQLLDQIKENRGEESSKILGTGLLYSTFSAKISRAFTHFFKVGNPESEQKYFKQLRKSRMTEIKSILGDKAHYATGHSSNNVLKDHYIDKVEACILMMKLIEQKDSPN